MDAGVGLHPPKTWVVVVGASSFRVGARLVLDLAITSYKPVMARIILRRPDILTASRGDFYTVD
jgi:hypothetical protein